MSKALTVSPAVGPSRSNDLVDALVSSGAILTLAGIPVRRHLVGRLVWLASDRFFWFTAHGDTVDDGDVLEFDECHAISDQWICFYRAGQLAACLAAIPAAGLEDPDDYLIAWQLWHEVVPRREKLIWNSLARFAAPATEDTVRAQPPDSAGLRAIRERTAQS